MKYISICISLRKKRNKNVHPSRQEVLYCFHPVLESEVSCPVPGKEKAGKDRYTVNFPYSNLTASHKFQIMFCDTKFYFYDKIVYDMV